MTESHVVPVSMDRHARRWWRRARDFSYALSHSAVRLDAAESEAAAAHLPIAFRAGTNELVALLHSGGKPAVVAEDGYWRADYLPQSLRIAPFLFLPLDGGKDALAVDESFGLVTEDPRDERFFTPGGKPSEAIAPLLEEAAPRIARAHETARAVAALRAANLLEPLAGHAGFEGVNADALKALSGPTLHILHQAGALALAHHQRASLSVLPRLAAFANPKNAHIVAPHQAGAAPSSGLSDFLSAVALAHQTGEELL